VHVTTIHGLLSNTAFLFTGIAGVWGALLYLRRRKVDGGYWGILAIGELLLLSQGVLGLLLVIDGARPDRSVHFLYGVVAAITLPAYYGITRGRDDRTAALIYGLLCFFLAAIASRAALTGG
jgi:hypothetical protein